MSLSKHFKTFPKQLYHREKPGQRRRVENLHQEKEAKKSGWQDDYVYAEYPKMIYLPDHQSGLVVQDEKEERIIMEAKSKAPKVEKRTVHMLGDQVVHQEGGIKPVQGGPPVKGKSQVQVPNEEYRIYNADGEEIPDHVYTDWKEALAAQKELNSNVPGHKAKKVE